MKPTTMILGFLPWIAFGIIVPIIGPNYVAWSALIGIALVLAGAALTRELHRPNQMSVGSLIPLTAMAMIGFASGDDVHAWLLTWGVPGLAAALGAFLLVMLPFAPFTQRYARSMTPRAYWTSPLFRRTNLIMSAAWGVAMILLGAGTSSARRCRSTPTTWASWPTSSPTWAWCRWPSSAASSASPGSTPPGSRPAGSPSPPDPPPPRAGAPPRAPRAPTCC